MYILIRRKMSNKQIVKELEKMKERLYEIADTSGWTDVEYELKTAYDRIFDAIEIIKKEEIEV